MPLRTTPRVLHGDFEWEDPTNPEDVVRIIMVTRSGERCEMKGKVGDNLLYVSHPEQRVNGGSTP